MLGEPWGHLLVPCPLDCQCTVQQEGPAAGVGIHGIVVALVTAPHSLDYTAVLGGQCPLEVRQGPTAGCVSMHPCHQVAQALGARSDQVHQTRSLLCPWWGLGTNLCASLPVARRGDVDSLQEGLEEAMALVELGMAVLADELRQSWVLVDGHPQQMLEVPGENSLPWRWSA